MTFFDKFSCEGKGELEISTFPKNHEHHGKIGGTIRTARTGTREICLVPNKHSEKQSYIVKVLSQKDGESYDVGNAIVKQGDKSEYLAICISDMPNVEKHWLNAFLTEDKKHYRVA